MVNFLSPEKEPIDTFKEGAPKGVAPGGHDACFKSENQPTEYPEVEEVIETGIAKRDPFDPAPLIDLFKSYHSEIDKMANQAMGLIITDDASLKLAVEMTTQAKALFQQIDKQRIKEKAPYKNIVDVLDGETGGLKKRTAQIEVHLNGKIQPYLQKKEAERREKERLAAVEAAKVQAELDAKAESERLAAAETARQAAIDAGLTKREADAEAIAAAAMVEAAPVVVAQATEETKVLTDTGSAKLDERWVFDVVNFKEIPDDIYESRRIEIIKAMTPMVNAKIKAGMRNIPGLKIYKEVQIKTRTSKTNFKF